MPIPAPATTASRPRILMLGDPPYLRLEQWKQFQQRFEVISPDLSSRESFMQALREKRCVPQL